MTIRRMCIALFAAVLCAAMLLAGCSAVGPSEVKVAPTMTEAPETEPEFTEPEYSAPELLEMADLPVPEGTVEVHTAEEFLAAIGSDTVIFLQPGVYNLSGAAGYGTAMSGAYRWEGVFDGWQLEIDGVENLQILGADARAVQIVTEPRYANVLSFLNCRNITVSGVTVGHTQAPGYCTGGVLYFRDSEFAEVGGCRLYGCGTLGIEAENCGALSAMDTEIFQCSYGAVRLYRCENVRMDGCSFHDCRVVTSLFAVDMCREVAVINSEIRDNIGDDWTALLDSNSRGVYFGGLDVHGNEAGMLLRSYGEPVRVEKSSFSGNLLLAPEGDMLYDTDAMERETVTWEPEPREEIAVPAPEAGPDGWIHVSTVDELLAAIGPDARIALEPGEYNLWEASDYGIFRDGFYYWEAEFDGPELVITNVDNLTIRGASREDTTICAGPRYANVLRFEQCMNVQLESVTAGHSIEPGYCSGGVLKFDTVTGVEIVDCGLYGCGVVGIWANSCQELHVKNSEIYECSDGALWLWDCRNVTVDDTVIRDIGGPDYRIDDCTNVRQDGEEVYPGGWSW